MRGCEAVRVTTCDEEAEMGRLELVVLFVSGQTKKGQRLGAPEYILASPLGGSRNGSGSNDGWAGDVICASQAKLHTRLTKLRRLLAG